MKVYYDLVSNLYTNIKKLFWIVFMIFHITKKKKNCTRYLNYPYLLLPKHLFLYFCKIRSFIPIIHTPTYYTYVFIYLCMYVCSFAHFRILSLLYVYIYIIITLYPLLSFFLCLFLYFCIFYVWNMKYYHSSLNI